jgi:uncharacterized protein
VTPLSPRRPAPLQRTWLRNNWEELTFVHWAYAPEVVQRLLPAGLDVDTFEGRAYVSLIPFRMSDASPRGLPAVPWISRFSETNVRTYVVDAAGNHAIWFFSLDANRLPIVLLARSLLGFPYVWSKMSIDIDGDRRRYETQRRRWPRTPSATSVVAVEIGERIPEPSELDVFLTARWGTIARWPSHRGALRHHPVDHAEWELHQAALLQLDSSSVDAAGLPSPTGEPMVRWAKPIAARFAPPSRV